MCIFNRKYVLQCVDFDDEFANFTRGNTPKPPTGEGDPSHTPPPRRFAPHSGAFGLSFFQSPPNFKSWLRPWYEACSIKTRNSDFKLFKPRCYSTIRSSFLVLDALMHGWLYHLPLEMHPLSPLFFPFKLRNVKLCDYVHFICFLLNRYLYSSLDLPIYITMYVCVRVCVYYVVLTEGHHISVSIKTYVPDNILWCTFLSNKWILFTLLPTKHSNLNAQSQTI